MVKIKFLNYGKIIFGDGMEINNKHNVICYLSELGHNNFVYPTEHTAILSDECKYEKLNYLSGTDKKLVAIKVKNQCLHPVTINYQSIKLMNDEYSIVWIEK